MGGAIGHDILYLSNPDDLPIVSTYEYIVNIYTELVDKENNLYTKVVTISPKYILVNETFNDL